MESQKFPWCPVMCESPYFRESEIWFRNTQVIQSWGNKIRQYGTWSATLVHCLRQTNSTGITVFLNVWEHTCRQQGGIIQVETRSFYFMTHWAGMSLVNSKADSCGKCSWRKKRQIGGRGKHVFERKAFILSSSSWRKIRDIGNMITPFKLHFWNLGMIRKRETIRWI